MNFKKYSDAASKLKEGDKVEFEYTPGNIRKGTILEIIPAGFDDDKRRHEVSAKLELEGGGSFIDRYPLSRLTKIQDAESREDLEARLSFLKHQSASGDFSTPDTLYPIFEEIEEIEKKLNGDI